METADILVVGTGAAGLFNALQLPESYQGSGHHQV